MKDILLPIIAIVIWCVVSIFYVRLFKAKGYRIWLSRLGGICGGMVAALIFLIIFTPKNEEKEKQEKTIVKEDLSAAVQQLDKNTPLDTKLPVEAKAPTVATNPQPAPEQSNNYPPSIAESVKSSAPPEAVVKKAMSLDEAKSLASDLNILMEKMERLIIAGLETEDYRGINQYVSTPLKASWYHFNNSFVRGVKPEPIALFAACGDAAVHLQDYVNDILMLQPGVYKAQRLESDLKEYYSNKEKCGSLVNESDQKTNSRWRMRIEEHKKLIDSLGGEDCFTVYTADGAVPKPAHCKK